jgi:hypothetical protein
MATGQSDSYDLPYPLAEDMVNVHGDIQQLVEKLEAVLPLASYSQVSVKNTSLEAISAGDPLYVTGYTTSTTVARSKHINTQPILGLAKTSIAVNANGICVVSGVVQGVNTSGYSVGDILYVDTEGGLSNSVGHGGAVGVVVYAAENGIISVDSKGNGTWGALKAGLA